MKELSHTPTTKRQQTGMQTVSGLCLCRREVRPLPVTPEPSAPPSRFIPSFLPLMGASSLFCFCPCPLLPAAPAQTRTRPPSTVDNLDRCRLSPSRRK